jgi:geranylgeranyl diphosphate synthase type I
MPLSELQNQLFIAVETHLKTFFNSQNFSQSQELKHMLAYHMGWYDDNPDAGSRGKRLRPLLVLLCTGAFNEDIDKIMPGAISLEFLHNFTLIHDDIEDRSILRHGRPTLWKKWGIPQAINAGDALFSIAQLSMLSIRGTLGDSSAAVGSERLNQVCLQLTRGQYLDLSFEDSDVITPEKYFEMINGKTAALIGLAASLCATVTGKNTIKQDLLSDFGRSLGMAFQIQDDILGIWGDVAVTGKSASSDILAHKKSLPVIFGLAHSSQFRSLWVKKNPTEEDVILMADTLVECGARDYASSQVEIFTQKAFNALESLFPECNKYSQALFELTEKLLIRQS